MTSELPLMIAVGVVLFALMYGLGDYLSRRAAASPRGQRAARRGWCYEGSGTWTHLVPDRYFWQMRPNTEESRPGADDSVPVLLFEARFLAPTGVRLVAESVEQARGILDSDWPVHRFPRFRLQVEDTSLLLTIRGETPRDDVDAEQLLLCCERLVQNVLRQSSLGR